MNKSSRICLLVLSLSCMSTQIDAASVKPIKSIIDAIQSLSKCQWALIGTIGGLYGWYLKRKPVITRCNFNDVINGKNLRYLVPDFIPGHPKVPGKVVLKNEDGDSVEFVYKEDIEGAGPIYWIESNAKNIAKVVTAIGISIGLVVAHKYPGTIGEKLERVVEWFLERFSKVKAV